GAWRKLRVGTIVAVLVLATASTGSVAAEDKDVCPEPNDALQAACNIGTASDALGFISTPTDMDTYRLETHDFGTTVHLTLPDRPRQYRLSLVGYDGEVLRSTD